MGTMVQEYVCSRRFEPTYLITTMCINMSSIFSRNSEAFVSELPENSEEMFYRY